RDSRHQATPRISAHARPLQHVLRRTAHPVSHCTRAGRGDHGALDAEETWSAVGQCAVNGNERATTGLRLTGAEPCGEACTAKAPPPAVGIAPRAYAARGRRRAAYACQIRRHSAVAI